jgi:hypothetical protein
MPVKVTSTQIRPNTTVDWYTPDKLGEEMAKHSLGYDSLLLEAPTVEISSDGLTYTKTFLFPDGWDYEANAAAQSDKNYIDTMKSYLNEYNIEFELQVEKI